jgi:hypothetical protein
MALLSSLCEMGDAAADLQSRCVFVQVSWWLDNWVGYVILCFLVFDRSFVGLRISVSINGTSVRSVCVLGNAEADLQSRCV